MNKTLFLLDGYSVIYRSYFALIRNPLRNPQGRNSSAVFGFFRTIHSLFQEYQPNYFAVAMDPKGPTFRHEAYPEYKANREKAPDDLHEQVPVIEEILGLMKIPFLRVDGFEADDIMATLARRCEDEGVPCRVITGDKDLLQLVKGETRVLRPSKGNLDLMDRDAVERDWGIFPEQILDYLSLVGDSSDNVPGVKGVGAKTAADLLQTYGTLDAIYDHLGEITSKSRRTKLEEGRENAYLSRELITLRYDVPLSESLDDLYLEAPDYITAAPLLAAEGFHTLLRDMNVPIEVIRAGSGDGGAAIGGAGDGSGQGDLFGGGDATASADGAASRSGGAPRGAGYGQAGSAGGAVPQGAPALMPEILIDAETRAAPGTYKMVASLESLDRWVADARKAGIVAFDCETDSLDALTAKPVGFSLCWEWGHACYIPLVGPDGPVLDEGGVRERLRSLLEDPAVGVVGQNIKYDYKVLHRWGVTIATIAFDTMVAAWLVNAASGGYGMDAMAERFLGYQTVHFTDVVGSKDGLFSGVALDKATDYAAEDADITFRLYRVLEPMLEPRGVKNLFLETELPLITILATMELEGIGLNGDELACYSVELTEELEKITAEIHGLAGHEFNIASTKQLQEVLFTERKLQPVKKTKTGYSTDNAVLQVLAKEDPIPALVLRYRQLSKLRSTYVEALPKLINAETERIHTHFNITGTATGRLSSTDPNLQNIPIREEEGRRIRSAFVSREGWSFVSADYSQVELVVLAHLSGDPALADSFRHGEDIHRRTASLLFGVEPDEVTSDQRRIAKTINFGVMYGMSAFRLSNELEIPRKEAAAFIEAYFRTYAKINEFIAETVRRTERDGEVRTLLGRPRPVPDINNRNKTVKAAAERVAVNTPIQGSAADIVKRAMLAVSKRLEREKLRAKLVLQVHDELIIECPDDEIQRVSALLMEEMSQAVPLSVPLRVSVESGRQWGEMHA